MERDTTSPVASDVNGSISEVSPGVLGFNTFTEEGDLHMQLFSDVQHLTSLKQIKHSNDFART